MQIDLTVCLLVSFADNICKQFGPRSGSAEWQAKSFGTLMVLHFFPHKFDFRKLQTTTRGSLGPGSLTWDWLISGVEPFVKLWKSASWGTILWNYFEFGSVVQEMSCKIFLICSSGSPLVWCSRTISAIWNDDIMGNTHVKLNGILDQWFKRWCRLKTFLSRALTASLFSRPKPFVQLW